jgi:hypothetical protein
LKNNLLNEIIKEEEKKLKLSENLGELDETKSLLTNKKVLKEILNITKEIGIN